MSSHVREAYGEGVRGIMKGMGGLSGPCRTHKVTPEELKEFKKMVADHEKVWGKPEPIGQLDMMLQQPGRHPRKSTFGNDDAGGEDIPL